ncbi:hypothetical protein DQ04_02511060 [Trypanosoma grayi]|uniref:hypothetical protein n=1 Tax=Trypanosoma grayi TaxID=71804 RepID=UPI0004F447EC|nr:hypothetical protein DQ04_02511060 [Trypanosoma grayi]KEG11547.1 hypothetical protein DQ04_02511060 [Trypanosoma grayi]
MQRTFGVPPPAMYPSHQSKDEEDLVRQLVEAVDVDEVIERMEMDHYQHLSPIVQNLKPFDRVSSRGERFDAVHPQESLDVRLNAPMRSPVDDADEHKSNRRGSLSTWSAPRPHTIISPPLPVQEQKQPQQKLLNALSAASPHVSDADTSSAPHDNDHTEKPSLLRRHRSRPYRSAKLRAPVNSPNRTDMKAMNKREHSLGSHQRRRQHERRRAPSFGEVPPPYLNRELELNRSYRELSNLRAPSADTSLRGNFGAEHVYHHNRHSSGFTGGGSGASVAAGSHRRAFTPPPPEISAVGRHSPSPSPDLPPWSARTQDDAWAYQNSRSLYFDRNDYWGHMDRGFECTPTATTEEAHTPDDADFDEEEDGEYVAVPPRIIEREQHRRPRVVEPLVDNSNLFVDPAGDHMGTRREAVPLAGNQQHQHLHYQGGEEEEEEEAKEEEEEEDVSHDPTFNTHTVRPRSSTSATVKGAGTKNNVRNASEVEYHHNTLSLSSLAPTPQERSLADTKEQVDASRIRSQSRNRSQLVNDKWVSATISVKDDNTSRQDATSGRQSGHRMSPALSPMRLLAPTSTVMDPSNGVSRGDKNADAGKGRVRSGVEDVGGRNKKPKGKNAHGARRANKREKKERPPVSPALSEGSLSSYSYSYTSYSGSSTQDSEEAPAAQKKAATGPRPMQRIETTSRPPVGPKIFPSKGPIVHPPLNNHQGNRMKQPVLAPQQALQRKQQQGPPPPRGRLAMRPPSQRCLLSASLPGAPRDGVLHSNSFLRSTEPIRRPPYTFLQSRATGLSAAPPCDESLRSAPRSAALSSGPYVSYLPHSVRAPTSAKTPAQTTPQEQMRSVSMPTSVAMVQGEVREIVWRTSDRDSVEGKNHKAPPPPAKTNLSSHYIPPRPRSASTGANPPPPKNLPLRAQDSVRNGRSASANRIIEVPRQRPSRQPSASGGTQVGISAPASSGNSPNPQKPNNQGVQVPTFVIQLPRNVRRSEIVTPSAIRVEVDPPVKQ